MSLLKVEDNQLLVDLNGTLFTDKTGKKRLSKSTIYLVDEEGHVVGTYQTDDAGNFKFTNLPADKNYMIKLNESDPSLFSKDVFLADKKVTVVATLKLAGKFSRYSLLSADEQSLARIYFNDPWLMVPTRTDTKDVTIIENIYFEYQKWNLLSQAIITLNKVVGVMEENPAISIELLAHTDSRGSEDFNMKLSEKRAQAAVDYIVSKGINKSRLTATGMGETHLVNGCKDGVECSEEQHAQNRRTEFKVKKGTK